MGRVRAGVAVLVILALAAGACGRGDDTPAATIQALFEKVKGEEVEEAGDLIYPGRLDAYDVRYLVDLFGPGDVLGVEAGVASRADDRATVALTLVTDAGRLPGRVPLTMVRQDGDWKVEYFGWSWPTALKRANFR